MGKGAEGRGKRKGWFSKRRRDERRAEKHDPVDALTSEHSHARRSRAVCLLAKVVSLELDGCETTSDEQDTK